jgi:outer membrane autotransporter protein
MNGKVGLGDKDDTVREAGFDFDTVGLTGGFDYRFDQNLVLGFAIGYAAVNSNFDRNRGGLDIESWSGSLFGTYFVADKFYVDGMLTYGQNDYDSVRHITFTDASGLTAETAVGDTDGMQLSGGLASGFDLNRGKWTFGPHVGLYYVQADTDGFAERGAGGLNLVLDDQEATSFTVNAGGHLSYALTLPWGVLVPHLRADYVHEFEDSRETVNLRFAADPFSSDPTDPTPVIELETDSPDPDYFVWSAGVSAQFIHGISGFITYRSMAGFDDFSLGEFTYGLRMETSL